VTRRISRQENSANRRIAWLKKTLAECRQRAKRYFAQMEYFSKRGEERYVALYDLLGLYDRLASGESSWSAADVERLAEIRTLIRRA
jgi:hypothetical protein